MLWLYKRVWFSEISNHHVEKISDVNKTEFIALGLMAAFVIFLGILPNYTLSLFDLPSAALVETFVKH
jgi:NADH:ubiquinone oxidoreductase subunit 4 (subunit M)